MTSEFKIQERLGVLAAPRRVRSNFFFARLRSAGGFYSSSRDCTHDEGEFHFARVSHMRRHVRMRRSIRYVNEKGGSPATETGLLLRKQIEAQIQEVACYQSRNTILGQPKLSGDYYYPGKNQGMFRYYWFLFIFSRMRAATSFTFFVLILTSSFI